MYKLYGIPNCDTVRKARKQLEAQGVEYEFCDFKKGALTKELLRDWKKQCGQWPLNRKGRTFKALEDDFESADTAKQLEMLLEQPSALKRPLLTQRDKVISLGFDVEVFAKLV